MFPFKCYTALRQIDSYRVRKNTFRTDMRDTSWYHPVAKNHRSSLPPFTGKEYIKKIKTRWTMNKYIIGKSKLLKKNPEREKKKSQTNLELLQASRALKEASEALSQPQNPMLCLHSPHSSLAGGGKNLEEEEKSTVGIIFHTCRMCSWYRTFNLCF